MISIELFIAILTLIAGITGGLARFVYANRLEALEDRHESELKRATTDKDLVIAKMEGEILVLSDENERLTHQLGPRRGEELVQIEKLVYVKYTHIKPRSGSPAYTKFIDRIEEIEDIYSECYFVRFNKFNRVTGDITLTDRSQGIVDMALLFPWRDLVFTDEPRKKMRDMIQQDVSGSESYLTATTYYNGFSEGNEDIGMKMEYETEVARIVADFSSIEKHEQLFIAPPDGYITRIVEGEAKKDKVANVMIRKPGVYYLEARDLTKGAKLELDFHVDWNDLD